MPAGARHTEVEASVRLRQYGVPLNATVYGLAPHMHTLGTSVSVDVTRAGAADSECLVDIPRWDFHWQQFYLFQEPLRVTPDDTIRLRCRYDNTPARQPVVDGVPQAPREVHVARTFDEMSINYTTPPCLTSEEPARRGIGRRGVGVPVTPLLRHPAEVG